MEGGGWGLFYILYYNSIKMDFRKTDLLFIFVIKALFETIWNRGVFLHSEKNEEENVL